jgi:hypothetical protein
MILRSIGALLHSVGVPRGSSFRCRCSTALR